MNEKLQSVILMALLLIFIYFTIHPIDWMLKTVNELILFSAFLLAMTGAIVKGQSYKNAPEFMIIFLMIFLGWVVMAVPSIDYSGFLIGVKSSPKTFNLQLHRNLLLTDISIFTYTLTYLLK